MIRMAISPRLATRTRVIKGGSHPEDAEVRRPLDRAIGDGGQADSQHRAGVPRVDHPVVVDPAGQEHRQRLRFDLRLDLALLGDAAFDRDVGLGERVMVFSGEMTPERQLKRMAKQATGQDRPTMGYIDAVGDWLRDRLWLFNVVGSATIDRLLTVFLYAVKRYGIRHFVIDSLMMTDVPEDGPGAITLQKKAMQSLCDFAKRNGCHVHLVAHPRKGKDETGTPGKMDVAGSSKITDGADNVFSVWSARKDESAPMDDSPDGGLELQKQRNGEVQHFKLHLWFDKHSMQFTTNSKRRPVPFVQYEGKAEAHSF